MHKNAFFCIFELLIRAIACGDTRRSPRYAPCGTHTRGTLTYISHISRRMAMP